MARLIVHVVIWITGIVVALFVLDRLFLWFEAKGWVYWRKVKRKSSGGAALMTFNAVFDPSAHQAIEVREERILEEDEDDGDDDGERKPDDRVS